MVLGVGIFVIAFAVMFTINSGHVREQEQLSKRLSDVQALLPKVTSNRADLESQLAQKQDELAKAQSLLSTSKGKFPRSVESIDCGEVLFNIADKCDLGVSGLTSEAPRDEKVKVGEEEIIYTVTTFEVTVQAAGSPPGTVAARQTYIDETVGNILDFVDEVVTGGYFTGVTIDSVNMEKLQTPSADEVADNTDKPQATIKLVIYSYKGE